MSEREPIHWSTLKHILQSPRHYQNVLASCVPETAFMRFGSLVDALVFSDMHNYVVYDGRRQGKAWEQFEADNVHRSIVTVAEWDRAEACAESISNHAQAMVALAGTRQRTHRWEINGRECSGTPDVVGTDAIGIGFITDLKISHATAPARFPWHARKSGWLAQLDWYAEGARLSGGLEINNLMIVAVEPKAPHDVVVYHLTERARECGRKQWKLAWERLMQCEESDQWPGYCDGLVPLDVPDDDELTLEIDGEEVKL